MKNFKNRKPLLVYFNNYPAPYVIDRLNELVKTGKIDVEAWFLSSKSIKMGWIDGNTSDWKFNYKFVSKFQILFTKNYRKPDLFISLYNHPTFILNILFYKLLKVKTFLHYEKTFDSWVKRTFWKEKIKTILFNLADGFHINGSDCVKQIKKYLFFKKKFIFVPWSMNLAFKNNVKPKFKIFKNKIKFLYVGRIVEEKGLETVINIFYKIKKKKIKFSFQIVGNGNFLKRLKKKVKLLNLSNNIFFFKKQSWKSLSKFYLKNDIFILNSSGDTYAMTIDEAISHLMPVISSSTVGDLKLRLKNNFNGKIFKHNSSYGLINSILFYYKNRSNLMRHSKNCKDVIPVEYLKIYAKKILKLMKITIN